MRMYIFQAYKGSIIPVESLAVPTYSIQDITLNPTENIIKYACNNSASISSSTYLKSLLLSKSKQQDVIQSKIKVAFGGHFLEFECSEPLELSSPDLECKGYIQKSMLSVKLKSKLSASVAASEDNHKAQSVFQYLYSSNRVAVIQTLGEEAADMMLVTADGLSAGSVQLLHPSDANFMALMFRLKKIEVEPVTLPEGGLVQCIPSEYSFQPIDEEVEGGLMEKRGFWDANAFEAWRRKDVSGSG